MKKYYLIIILAVAFIFRVWALDRYPIGFTPDEASFGYDAYSIIKTGKDQWGHTMPLVLESFGDGKLPLYGYLTIPSVFIFGLNEFSTRLPSALVGTLAVFSTYLFVLKLFKRKDLALLSSLMLALSPWHIPLSRGAFEANLSVFFLSIGAYFFLSKKDILSGLLLGINLFSYHSARLVTPRIVFGVLFLTKSDFNLKKSLKGLVVFSFFLILAFYTVFSGGATRAGDVTIFNPTDKWQSLYNDRYGAIFDGEPYTVAKVFNNKITYLFDALTNAYSTYLSPQFLFTLGPSETTYGMTPGVGVMHIFEFIFLLFLFYQMTKNKYKENLPILFLLFWFLVGIVPAALTKGPGYAANRAAVVMPSIQILSSLGAIYFFEFLKSKLKFINSKVYIIAFGLALFVSSLFFIESYFYKTPRQMAEGMLYGRQEMMEYLNGVDQNYKKVVVSRSLSEPQIFVAFYKLWDPSSYQLATKDWDRYKVNKLPFLDQLGEYSLGKYEFRGISYYDYHIGDGVLLVGKPNEFPNDVKPLKTIFYPNQMPAIYIVEPNNK